MKLPKGEDLNEWLAVCVVDFFNELNLIYGTISEQCTKTSCPKMTYVENANAFFRGFGSCSLFF